MSGCEDVNTTCRNLFCYELLLLLIILLQTTYMSNGYIFNPKKDRPPPPPHPQWFFDLTIWCNCLTIVSSYIDIKLVLPKIWRGMWADSLQKKQLSKGPALLGLSSWYFCLEKRQIFVTSLWILLYCSTAVIMIYYTTVLY